MSIHKGTLRTRFSWIEVNESVKCQNTMAGTALTLN